VSGTFLWIIGILNRIVLLDIVRIARELRRGRHDKARLEERLEDRGFMSRFFLGGFFRMASKSWQMYPLGMGLAGRARLREARLRRRRALPGHLGRLGRDLEGAPHR
jgi:hypothetical protein